jgi:hypothetical protein
MGICFADDLDKYITMLLYAPNRTGKTYFFGTSMEVPEAQPSLVIDCDGGYETLRRFYPKQPIYPLVPALTKPLKPELNKDGTPKIVDPDFYKPILVRLQELPEIIKKGGYKVVFLDTLSTLSFNLIDEIAGNGVVKIQHWNELFLKLRRFVVACKKVCEVFIAAAFPIELNDDEGKVIGYTPLIQGKKFPTIMMSEFNTIAHYNVKHIKTSTGTTTERIFNAKANGITIAGDRFGAIAELKNPKFADLYYKIFPKEKN